MNSIKIYPTSKVYLGYTTLLKETDRYKEEFVEEIILMKKVQNDSKTSSYYVPYDDTTNYYTINKVEPLKNKTKSILITKNRINEIIKEVS